MELRGGGGGKKGNKGSEICWIDLETVYKGRNPVLYPFHFKPHQKSQDCT